MRCLCAANNIFYPSRLQSSFLELGQAGVEQPPHCLAALGPEPALLRRNAAAERWTLRPFPVI